MADTSAIEWTDSTFNPWIGCSKISPACEHCYAEALMDKRRGRVKWGGARSRTAPTTWQQPRHWQRMAPTFFALHGRRRRVFCASLADVFDNQVPDQWRVDLWMLIADCPDIDWLLLTKRPQNIGGMLPEFWEEVKGHVWLGTTVEDQQRADQNIPHLLKHDSAVRFLSCEPMVGAIDLAHVAYSIRGFGPLWAEPLTGWTRAQGHGYRERDLPNKINWVIAGGESGPLARPSHPDWFRSLRDQCAAAGVPFLFKQWGEWADTGPIITASGPLFHQFENGAWVQRYGKKANGRSLDGVIHDAFPEVRHA